MNILKHPLETQHTACTNKVLLGWHKETIIYDISGCDWYVETYKWKGAIRCCAKVGYASEEEGILFVPANRPVLRLDCEYRNCSKNRVIAVHEAGLKRFNQVVASGLIQVPQHIKTWVMDQKYRTEIAKYPKTASYTSTHI